MTIYTYCLVGNAVREKLELIVYTRAVTLSAPAHKRAHEVSRLALTLVEYKPLLEMLDGFRLETWQA